MITILLEVINKILNLIIAKVDENKQQVSQNERDQIESDPAVYFSKYYDGMSDADKHPKDAPTN